LNNLLTNYGSTGTTWQQGNFNYAPDGTDFGDLNSLLTNYQQSLVYGTSAINAISDHLDAPAIQMLEARGFSVVPEPCTLSLLGLGALGLMRRRRRLATR
jgi:hypothetical protein